MCRNPNRNLVNPHGRALVGVGFPTIPVKKVVSKHKPRKHTGKGKSKTNTFLGKYDDEWPD